MERAPEKVYVPNVPATTISFILHEYWLNHWLIRCLLNFLECIDLSWCDLDQREPIWNICDSKSQDFCAQLFQLQNYFCAQNFFGKFVASKVFTFNFYCAMPQQSPVGDIWSPSYRIEDVAVALTVRLWDRGNDMSLWVHPSSVINIAPIYGNISTNIQTPEEEVVPITVSRSGFLFGLDDGWLNIRIHPIFCVIPEWVCDIYQEFYRPSYFSRQRYPSRLFCTRHQILNDIFPKQSAQ